MSNTFLPPGLRAAATEVSALLKARNETISVAETVSKHSSLFPDLPASVQRTIPSACQTDRALVGQE